MQGKLFVISAPSGAGKTTLLKKIMAEVARLRFSISHTTRSPRSGEKNGVDYHFISRKAFLALRDNEGFIEYAEVHGKFYGTSKKSVQEITAAGNDVVLDIDVQGAAILRDNQDIDIIDIFITPPSSAELERRLRKRGTEDEETIRLRIKNAEQEMAAAEEYRYLLVNDQIEKAAVALKAIIIAERAAGHRTPEGEPIRIDRIRAGGPAENNE